MKKTSLLVIAFIITLTVSAQTSNSLLWKVSGNGLNETSYLYGTLHLMCEEDFEIKTKTKEALGKSKTLFLELNFSDPAEMEAMQKITLSDKKLSEQLTEEQASELTEVLKSYQLTLEQVDHLNPQTLYSLSLQKAITCAPANIKSSDIEIMKLALADKKSVQGLETVAEQMEVIGKAYRIDEVIDQLALGDEYAAIFKKTVGFYKEENLAKLDVLLRDPRFMDAEQERWMLTERNKNWVNEMPEQMTKESTFFAVGAGHLLGDHGVIQLLKEQGYTVEPIFN